MQMEWVKVKQNYLSFDASVARGFTLVWLVVSSWTGATPILLIQSKPATGAGSTKNAPIIDRHRLSIFALDSTLLPGVRHNFAHVSNIVDCTNSKCSLDGNKQGFLWWNSNENAALLSSRNKKFVWIVARRLDVEHSV